MSKTKEGFKDKPKRKSKVKATNDDQHWNEYFDLPNPDLQAHFLRTESGQPEIYCTPFYGMSKLNTNADRINGLKEILDGWQNVMESSDVPEKWPSLMEFENGLREKAGPLSVMKPLSERLEDIDAYYDSILLESKPVDENAIAAVVNEFRNVRGIRIRGPKLTVDKMKKSTSSGSPYYRKRRDVVDLTLPVELGVSLSSGIEIPNETLPTGRWRSCAILGWRGQEGGFEPDDVKQRVIWMFSFGVNIRELQFYQPFIEICQRNELVPAWVSMDAVDERITRMFDTKGKTDLVVCTDFSKFDQHFNSAMQECARQVLMNLSNLGDPATKDWFTGVYEQKYYMPLAWDESRIRTGRHGMASGSGGTNCDETVAHRALQYECAQHHKAVLNPYSQCLGDDGVLTFPGIDADKVMLTYTQHGLEMNPDKQDVSTQNCTYLRRWHHVNYRENGVCVGVYSTYRALNRLAMQERFYDARKWSKEMVTLRYLSIIENVKWHPLRERFADYCIKGDKYRLGIDIPGFLENIDRFAQKATDEMPDFLGYTKSLEKGAGTGLSSWWIVNYLKSLA